MVLELNMRRLHRWFSVAASVFILYVAVTGVMMAIDNVYGSVYLSIHGISFPKDSQGPPPGLDELFSAGKGSVADADLAPMLSVTLAAARQLAPTAPPPRVIRLRSYAGIPQGVIVTGDASAVQLVFNTRTGKRAGLYEPGYPKTPFPFQWGAHELWKQMHRGDIFGLPGRWIDLLSGLGILFLSISGIVMYLQMHSARARIGRRGVFW
jgi:hypothetical protein